MDHARVTLRVTQGSLMGSQFIFEGPSWCVIGRGEDCTIRLPSDQEHAGVSRHHCLLEITPPEVRLRDLGSLNGTLLNGHKVGQRPASVSPEEAERESARTLELRDGDEVRVGYTVFRVAVTGSVSVEEVSFPMRARGR